MKSKFFYIKSTLLTYRIQLTSPKTFSGGFGNTNQGQSYKKNKEPKKEKEQYYPTQENYQNESSEEEEKVDTRNLQNKQKNQYFTDDDFFGEKTNKNRNKNSEIDRTRRMMDGNEMYDRLTPDILNYYVSECKNQQRRIANTHQKKIQSKLFI